MRDGGPIGRSNRWLAACFSYTIIDHNSMIIIIMELVGLLDNTSTIVEMPVANEYTNDAISGVVVVVVKRWIVPA
jgi:hypothetical protein